MYRTIIFCVMLIFCASLSAQEWSYFNSEKAGFRVKLEGEFIEDEQIIETEVGELTVHSFIYKPEDDQALNFLYLINYFDYPEDVFKDENEEMVDEFLRSSVLQSSEDLEGEVIYSSDITQDGFPGKLSRIQYQDHQAVVKSKMILAENRFYSIQVYSLLEQSLNDEIDLFLNSFRLTRN